MADIAVITGASSGLGMKFLEAQLDHFINELQQFDRTKTQIVFSNSFSIARSLALYVSKLISFIW